MSIWTKIFGIGNDGTRDAARANSWAIIDAEVSVKDKRINDIGALRSDGAIFHGTSINELLNFIKDTDFLCGHNIIHHDIRHLFPNQKLNHILVDTLYISPLLFPERPYHRLLKDDKLISDQVNNPVNDCEKARDLLMDERAKWAELDEEMRVIYTTLLKGVKEFEGFLEMVEGDSKETHGSDFRETHGSASLQGLERLIRERFRERICGNVNLNEVIKSYPVELAYALALIETTDWRSVTPAWVVHNYPEVEYVLKTLRETHCQPGCDYCNRERNLHNNLKAFFGYDEFRSYEGEPLQERAARAAVEGRSLLAIFPTGGGKSLTFQLPALMEGRSVHGLTVVISPLQSLMKDQVDNLADRGITEAVTINGLLDPITRALSIQRVMDGDASLLYIAPEMLRSKTIEKILLARNVVRFVIDEAHCFSAWGQDFRVDYLYIGKFISEYQKKKRSRTPIPVSCFTATAKQKVVQDIRDYFKQTVGLELEVYATAAARKNLRYSVIHADSNESKYLKLRSLIEEGNCPTIVYVSRTYRCVTLADRLKKDGFSALPFHGRMDSDDKITNQEAFMNNEAQVIVATSAFGMGVDKKDVGLVVHYDISESLENYVQEAGRAGRDPQLEAKCYVLYGEDDLDKHFILLNQTKLSISEIQQVWRAVKSMTKHRPRMCSSALEIARAAGWDDSVSDIESRVRTALSALEQSGYIERGNNVPHVYATGITVKNMDEARRKIMDSKLFEKEEIESAVRIIKSLITNKYTHKSDDEEGESRVDYLADILGISKWVVVSVVERMRQEGILADSKDISAYLREAGETEKRTGLLLERFGRLEKFLLESMSDEALKISYKQLNENAVEKGITTSKEKDIRTLLYFLTVKGYMRKKEDPEHNIEMRRIGKAEFLLARYEKRMEICRFAVEWLYRLVMEQNCASECQKGLLPLQGESTVAATQGDALGYEQVALSGRNNSKQSNDGAIKFSVVELLNDFVESQKGMLFSNINNVTLDDVEEALLYMSKIGALKLEGGFLVLYNAMDITRKKESRLLYKKEDYRLLDEFYKQKIQQVHIVGEYANLMVKDYGAAMRYVQDYFQMDYKKFINKYFKGERVKEIERNVTKNRFEKLFGQLSARQMEIINDKESRCIVVAAGPGSGKTRVLVHKLASLLSMEDVKHEQLLMLTFSRAAATEFKQRLMELIGNAAHFVEIKTFHSYCFDLLGRIGSLEQSENVVAEAAKMINEGEVEPNRIAKSVLVIDEAQDISRDEFELVRALMTRNEDMRVIAVGDDDQNIFEFRGANSWYMRQLSVETEHTPSSKDTSRFIEMTENYRSSKSVVHLANAFAAQIKNRLKSTPIISMTNVEGWVSVTKHTSEEMYKPLMDNMLRHRTAGSACVLTQTNEEAAIIVGLLRKNGIKCKLIQSIEGFRFWNLAEVRYFLKKVGTGEPVIAEQRWDEAKKATFGKYADSDCLDYLKRCIDIFEKTYKTKYRNDLWEFLFESSVEDFSEYAGDEVVVSTIHKSKGREFDDVYMLLSGRFAMDDEQRRRLYVGMTRAKNRLFIHTDGNAFDSYKVDEHIIDDRKYTMPEEVTMQLTHKDVNLSFFKTRKQVILQLTSGDELQYDNSMLFHNGIAVAKLSAKAQKELADWQRRGYEVVGAKIRFIVSWKPKDAPKEEKETAVILADLSITGDSPQ